jgi:purine-binding chemotaxis protein CheW
LSEEIRSKPDQPFKIGDLVRLNEELKQLRDTLKAKKTEREKAKREGKKLKVDLTPEIERLSKFLVELEIISSKVKSASLPGTMSKTDGNNALNSALAQVKGEIENERKKLEQERAAQAEERLRHEQELQLLRDELEKSKEVAETQKEPAKSLLSTEPEQAERPAAKREQDLPPPSVAPEQEATKLQLPGETNLTIQLSPPQASEAPRQYEETKIDIEDVRRSIERKVADEFSAIRTEVQMLREQISRQQDLLETRRKELDEDRRRIEDQKRILESQVADQFSATRSELQRLRDQVLREQDELETKRQELGEEKRKIDEEKRTLDRRMKDTEEQRLRQLTRQATEELESERMELTVLKRSLQQLRSESTRDRKRLEKDREEIRRTRVALENERRKVAWRNAILQIRSKSIEQASTQNKILPQKVSKKDSESPQKKQVDENPQPPLVAKSDSEGAVVLGVRLGDGEYGIDISKVREIMTKRPITQLPHQPTYVEGVINIRGVVMPVINLRKRFDLGGEVPQNPNIVILESSEGLVAILVDSVTEVIRIPQDKIHAPPAIAHGVDGEYLKGICQIGAQLLLYLDVDRILKKATPIAPLYSGGNLGMMIPALSREEQRVLNAIPLTGGGKTQLMKKGRVGSRTFDRVISSLSRKRLITINRVGKKKIIMHAMRQTR